MVSRSPDVTNKNGTRQTAAMRFLLPLSPKPKAIQSFSISADSFSNRQLQQEAAPALGRFAKRVLDLVISSAALLMFWPLMLVIAIAVKLDSRGSAIYASLRAGKRGVPFSCYKFR